MVHYVWNEFLHTAFLNTCRVLRICVLVKQSNIRILEQFIVSYLRSIKLHGQEYFITLLEVFILRDCPQQSNNRLLPIVYLIQKDSMFEVSLILET